MAIAKEQIRQIISENNINRAADVYSLLKDSFKDILQELMGTEMDATLSCEKITKMMYRPATKRMNILQKISKVSMGISD